MSGSALAAASAAAALYLFSKGCGALDEPWETHQNVHQAPQSWAEDFYFFAEGLRYTYAETLGRWRTADLLIGLAYLARREGQEHAAADITRQARPLGEGMCLEELEATLSELEVIERFMRYCYVMRERKMQAQREMFANLGIGADDILMHEMRAGVLKPSFVLVRDASLRAVVLSIRGTHSFKDMFTSLTGASKPHHLVDSNGVVLGYSHFGMLAAARWIKQQTLAPLERALADNPGYSLRVVGHSLGGGTAALLTMMLRERGGPFAGATCLAIACPSCMTLELARSCADYVTSLVHGADVVPSVSPGSADRLREAVTRSSWSREFRRDLRSSPVVRAVESGLRGMGSATWTATSWTTAKLSACYPRRRAQGGRALKRRNSDDWTGREGPNFGVTSAADEVQALLDSEQLHQQLGGPGEGGNATLAAIQSVTSASVLGMLSSSAPAGSSAAVGSSPQTRPPAGLGGSSLAHHHHQDNSSADGGSEDLRSAVWGRRIVGWSQRVGALTGRGAAALGSGLSSGSAAAVRSTGVLMSRVWSQSCRLPATCNGMEPADEVEGRGVEAAAALEPPSSPPSRMHMGVEDGQEGLLEGVREDVDAADSDALARELSLRMSEVEAAVEDAEEEEARRGGDDSTVPSVIRPGSYGLGPVSPSRRLSPFKQQEAQWRRDMYPAGRILHLVPASLLAAAAARPAPPSSTDTSSGSEEGADSGNDLASDSERSSSDYNGPSFADPCSPRPSPAQSVRQPPSLPASPAPPAEPQQRQRGQRQQWVPVRRLAAAAGETQQPHGQQQRVRHVSDLGLQDMIASDGALVNYAASEAAATTGVAGRDGPASQSQAVLCRSGDSSADEGVWVGSPGSPGGVGAAGERCETVGSGGLDAVAEGCVLLDWVPQQAYGRIKLCRRMLADHFIPTYLAAMESAQRHLHRRRALLAAQRQGQHGDLLQADVDACIVP